VRLSNAPLTVLRWMLAARLAAPLLLVRASENFRSFLGPFSTRATMPDRASLPKIVARAALRVRLLTCSLPRANISKIRGNDFRPFGPPRSLDLMPRLASAPCALSVGAVRRTIAVRSVVPAWEPLMPTLPIRPIAAPMSERL
jgi:hypothetical protein